LGIPPLVTQVGSFKDRIRDGETGFLVEPEKSALVDKIKDVSEKRDRLQIITSNLGKISFKTAGQMVMDYDRLISQINLSGVGGSELQSSRMQKEEIYRIKDQAGLNAYFKKVYCITKNQILNFKSH
jgi:glycosyltransferase involved in cell wall biosynthesis